jgi:hypothetical protein
VEGGVQLDPLDTAANNGLLCQPRVIIMMQKLVEWLAGETEALGENPPSAASSTTNSTCCPEENQGRHGGKPATNRLSYGTAVREGLLGITSVSFLIPSQISRYTASSGDTASTSPEELSFGNHFANHWLTVVNS